MSAGGNCGLGYIVPRAPFFTQRRNALLCFWPRSHPGSPIQSQLEALALARGQLLERTLQGELLDAEDLAAVTGLASGLHSWKLFE